MTTAHAAPADLTGLDDAALAALLAAVADDDAETDRVLAELERRDRDDAVSACPSDDPDGPPLTAEEERRAFLQGYRMPGESLVDAASRYYGDVTAERLAAAEEACRGILLVKAEGASAIDPYTLFHGNAARALKWASDELLRWWEDNPRVSWAEHMYEWTGHARWRDDAARARAAWGDALIRGRARRASPGEYRAPRTRVRKFGAREE